MPERTGTSLSRTVADAQAALAGTPASSYTFFVAYRKIEDVETRRDPITVRWRLLLALVVFMTVALAIGCAIATQSLSKAEAKVEAAVMASSRAQSEEDKALECADFADDKTRDEFISHGGPAKGCDMGYASLDRSRELVSTAHVKADQADVNAEIVQRNVTAAGGVVDRWIFGIGLAATMGAATLFIAPRRSNDSRPGSPSPGAATGMARDHPPTAVARPPMP